MTLTPGDRIRERRRDHRTSKPASSVIGQAKPANDAPLRRLMAEEHRLMMEALLGSGMHLYDCESEIISGAARDLDDAEANSVAGVTDERPGATEAR